MTTTSGYARTRATLGTLAAGVLFAAAVVLALGEPVAGWERATFAALNGLPDEIHAPVWAVMQAGSLLAVPFVAGMAFATGRRRLALGLAVAGAGAYLAALVVKELVDRARPDGLLAEVVVRGAAQHGLGFVSGHTTVAVALATVATPDLGPRGRLVVWTIAALVGLGRVYVGAHLPLDVVGGAALGVLVGLLALTLVRAAVRRSPGASA